jgi:uncharacterized protein (DUF433 family)
MIEKIITSSKDILGGTPVFKGTRVPILTFFDYLEGGDNIGDFLDDFPTVTREQVKELLKDLESLLLSKKIAHENFA